MTQLILSQHWHYNIIIFDSLLKLLMIILIITEMFVMPCCWWTVCQWPDEILTRIILLGCNLHSLPGTSIRSIFVPPPFGHGICCDLQTDQTHLQWKLWWPISLSRRIVALCKSRWCLQNQIRLSEWTGFFRNL